jgi:mannitol-1-phosphate/altronate dehydrogenase
MNNNVFLSTEAKITAAQQQTSLLELPELWEQQSPYNRRLMQTGIVHFGPGRFFRGHLARIIHRYLARQSFHDRRWGICGVSLKSRCSMDALQPQDYLYTLVERYRDRHSQESAEVIGSINQIVNGLENSEFVLGLMESVAVQLVTLTITQAGYCLDSQFNLDFTHEAIIHDLKHPTTPTTAIGFIVEALRRRRDRGLAPFATLSCDNLPRNGEILQNAVMTYAQIIDPALANYLSHHAMFPNTVVDRIVPQAQPADGDYARQLLQVCDRTPVITEPFWQFVVEDKFRSARPAWEDVGVIMTDDITPYLYVKSRFLNAMHSFIACLAVRAGAKYVHEAIRVPELYGFSQLLMDDIASATPVPYQLCEQYREQVLLRFANEALPDSIERIAAETARKVGKYIVPILQDAHRQKFDLERLILPIAAWMLAVREGSEFGKCYDAQDQLAVISAIRSGASLSQVINLEPSEWTESLNQVCDRALQEIRSYGILAVLRHYCEERYEVVAAA